MTKYMAHACVLVVLVLIMTGVSLYMKNIYEPKGIIKIAVKEKDLSDRSYILCIRTVSTGFDWIMIKDEDGNKTYQHCIVIGVNPFAELNLSADFIFADNTYVFYIIEKRTVFSVVTNQYEVEYVVAGWDILYPVKHGFPDFLSSKKFITEKDVGLK